MRSLRQRGSRSTGSNQTSSSGSAPPGALVVDIRPERQRADEGELGFGVVVERNVLEWRFDLQGSHALPEVRDYDQQVVIVCSEGYASSLAAASLRQLGFSRVADLAGGYVAWRTWRGGSAAPTP